MLKQKLKEIKMDWIRPLNYLEAQSNEHVVYDNENYIIDKGAMSNAVNARYAFQHLRFCKHIRNVKRNKFPEGL